MRETLVLVAFFASPTLDWWPSPFSKGVLFLRLLLGRLILLICIWTTSIERRFEFLPYLIKILLHLILPRLFQIYSALSLLIQVLVLSNVFCQRSRIIILNLFFVKWWQSTQKYMYLYLLILYKSHILQQSHEFRFIFSHGHVPTWVQTTLESSCHRSAMKYTPSENISWIASKWFYSHQFIQIVSIDPTTCQIFLSNGKWKFFLLD